MDLQEYSSAKLDRVTRYLGVLADKTRKLGKVCPLCQQFCRLWTRLKKMARYVVNFGKKISIEQLLYFPIFLCSFIVILLCFVYNEVTVPTIMTISSLMLVTVSFCCNFIPLLLLRVLSFCCKLAWFQFMRFRDINLLISVSVYESI